MSSVADRTAEGGLERLRRLLLAEGGLMASLVPTGEICSPPNSEGQAASPAFIAAAGPRAAAGPAEYELIVEAIYEGYLLHYGAPRVVQVPEADLRLLAGDQLYAIGLARLVALGDTVAVAELADTITLSALAQGADDGPLADAVWAAGAHAVGWGPSELHEHAKQLVRSGDQRAIEAIRTSVQTIPTPP